MATTIKGLKTALKKANKRVDKSIERYKKALLPLYLKINDNAVPRYVSAYDNSVIQGRVANFATESTWAFYRRGRDGKFYEKPQPKPLEGFLQEVWDNYRQVYQLVGQDYLDLRKLENAIDAAVNEREKLLWQLEDLGVDVYNDAELWQ